MPQRRTVRASIERKIRFSTSSQLIFSPFVDAHAAVERRAAHRQVLRQPRHRRRDQRASNAHQRRLVGRRHDDDGPGSCFRREIAFQEFFDFPSPLPDQGNHPDIRLRIAADHAQEHAFPHA